jgi:phosphatidylinositol dimannoside acyltransferase
VSAAARNSSFGIAAVRVAASTRSRDDVTVIAYKLAAAVAKATPGPIASASAPMLGLAFSQAMRSRRSMVERHIQRAKGPLSGYDLRRAVNNSFESYARYWIESFRLPSLTMTAVQRGIDVPNWQVVLDGLAGGKGVILALPHMGGWEWAGRWVADQDITITVVVETVEPPELFKWFRDLRSGLGMNVVPLGPEAGSAVLKALGNNEVVCLLCDRDLTHDGIEVEFFGERTTLPAGPATLAIRTGAPLIPAGVFYNEKGDHRLAEVRSPIDCTRTGRLREDVARVTQLLANELESLIRKAPEQWHLFQPNWPSDPGYGT